MQPGDYIDDRFWVEARIGAGGMGVVFRGSDEQSGKPVAIKIFTGKGEHDIARAKREAMAVAMLDHPGIVRHVASGVTPDGQLYLVMEWIEGFTVAGHIDRTGFTLREAVTVTRQVAAALACAHEAGIVHRDIKPTNVLLDRADGNRAKLIDFGVARFGTVATSLTLTGTAMGTPGYMAPEQVRGNRELTPATDVFGLGALFYEMASGHYAFTGAHSAALMAKVLFADPPPLAARCPEAPASLVHLCDRMLAKEAALRPSDGAAVVALIDALGPIPEGPRRYLQIEDPPKKAPVPAPLVHCMVIAAKGHPDELSDPPGLDTSLALGDLAHQYGGTVEVLTTGAVLAHFRGNAVDVKLKANRWTENARKLLDGWTVVMSELMPDAAAAADHGAHVLATAAIAAIFAGGPPRR